MKGYTAIRSSGTDHQSSFMPIGGLLPSARAAHARLVADSLPVASLLKQADHQRRLRLHQFLQQHRATGQWAISVAALVDAVAHGTPIGGREISDAILTCGVAGRSDVAKRLFYEFTKTAGVPRGGEVETAFFRTCGACGDYESAEDRLRFLLRRSSSPPSVGSATTTPSTSHNNKGSSSGASSPPRPISDELFGHLLDAAVTSTTCIPNDGTVDRHQRQQRSTAWSRALSMFVQIRRDPATRRCAPLTPAVLEKVTKLAEVGARWDVCAKLVVAAGDQHHCLVPPEAYDAAVRACFRKDKHQLVCALLQRCLSARVAPEELCVRMGMRSAEELAAQSAMPSLASSVMVDPHGSSEAPALPLSVKEAVASPTAMVSPWVLSLRLFQGLADNGLPLLPQTYEGTMRTCCMAGRWDAAMRIMSDMRTVDRRSCSAHMLRFVLLSRAEHAASVDEARAICEQSTLLNPSLSSSVVDANSGSNRRNMQQQGFQELATYLALLRCAARLGDWRQFHFLHAEMKRHEIPETYDVTKLLILSAIAQGRWASAVLRFARWMQTSEFEKQRLLKDRVVDDGKQTQRRWHDADFTMDRPLLHATLHACDQVTRHQRRPSASPPTPAQQKLDSADSGGDKTELQHVAAVVSRFIKKQLAGGERELLEGGENGDGGSELTSQPPAWLFVDGAVPTSP